MPSISVYYENPMSSVTDGNNYLSQCQKKIAQIHNESQHGDILCFVPTIADTGILQEELLHDRRVKRADIRVLTGKMSKAEQDDSISGPLNPNSSRRIIIATNVAELSITPPDAVYVVDSGFVVRTVNTSNIIIITL